MATNESLHKRLSEIYRRIDELRACALEDPSKIQEVLSSALEELEMSLKEHSAAVEEPCQQGEELTGAIEESEKHFKEIESLAKFSEENPSPILRVSGDGVVLYANASSAPLLQLWGCQVDQKLPENLIGILPNILKTGEVQEINAVCDKSVYVLAFAPIEGTGYINIYGRDITDLKQAEDKLLEDKLLAKEAELQIIAGATPIILTRCSRDLRYVFVNHACAELFGLSQEEIIGKPIIEIMGKEAFEAIRPHVEKVLQGERIEYEEEIPYQGAGSRFMRVTYVPEKDGQEVLGWLASVEDITNFKQTEKALKESDERLRLAQSYGGAGIWDWWPQTGVNIFDDEMSMLYGLPPGTVKKYDDWLSRVHPGDKAAMIAMRDRALSERKPFDLEFRIMHASGETRWIAARGRGVYDDAGQLIRVLGINIDITGRKRAEEMLRDSEERFSKLFTDSPAAMAITERNTGRFIDVNNAWLHTTGFAREEVIGRSPLEIGTSSSKESREELVTRALANPSGLHENVVTCKDGKRKVFLTKISTISLSGETALLSAGIDITERKKVEEAIRESEARFSTVLDHSQDVIYRLNLQTNRYEYFSHACKAVYGFSPAEMMAMDAQETLNHVHPDDLAGVKTALEDIHTIGYGRLEFRWLTRAGDYRWLSVNLNITMDSAGRPLYRDGVARDITERKQAEEALHQANELFENVLGHFDDTFGVFDSHWRYVFLNETAARRLGRPRNQLLGKDLRELIPQITATPAFAHLQAVANERWPHEWTERSPVTGLWLEWHAFPWEGGVAVLSRDVTERKRAEEALRESERKYRSIIDQSRDGIVLIDEGGRIIEWNPRLEALTSLKRDEVLNKYVWDLQVELMPEEKRTPRARENIKALIKDITTNGHSPILDKPIEWEVQRPDGTRFMVEDTPNVIPTDNGYMLCSTIRDISGRKRAEEALSAAHRQIQSIINNTPAIVYAFDLEERFVLANTAIAELFNTTPEQMMGKRRHEFMPGEDADWHEANDRKAIELGRALEFEEYSQLKDRSITWLTTKFPLKDAQGRIYAVAGISADITERKTAEEALQKAHDELEMRVQERTADLAKANVDLIKARDVAEAAVRAKAAFLANMSHELRTPMNAIIGFTNLLLDEPLTPDQVDCLERVRNSGDILLALIDDILEFSRAERQKIKLEQHPFSLKRCMEESLDLVSIKAKDKGLRIFYTPGYRTPDVVIGDQGRLRQVLINLLANAVKFTDKGKVSVSVSSKLLGQNKYELKFEVEDTGIGIPPDKMDLLFKPFSQVDLSSSSKYGGTGLGLAISKNLVELMGGMIWAESTPGAGSTFKFTIDAEFTQSKRVDSRRTVQTTSENLAEKKPLRILVAEDNPSNQRVLVEMLKKLGYRADVAADGLEVLEALEHLPYDLIFMDVKMPEMDGITATKEIRKCWPENGPKIVAITAYALDGDRERCLEAGMDDYIAKPVKREDLADLLRNITPPQE